MNTEIMKCSGICCDAEAHEDKVYNGTSGSLWGPYWFCDACSTAMDKQLQEEEKQETLTKET